MNILNKLTIKHLTMNKKRTVVSIIGILLSTALMVGIGLLCSTVRNVMIDEVIDRTGNYQISLSEINKDSFEIIKSEKNIKNYFYEKEIGFSKYEESNNEGKPYYYVNAVNDEYLKQIKLINGKLPENSNEILVSSHIFDYSNNEYNIGDEITLNIGTRYIEDKKLTKQNAYVKGETLKNTHSKTYKIVGIIERANTTFEPYQSPGFTLFTKIDNDDLTNLNVYINYKKVKDVEEKTNNLAKKINLDLNNVCYNTSLLSIYGESNYDNINSFISTFMMIFLSIVSVACIIVIYNSFAISVMERKKQFGLFASIGTTRKQIRHTVFYEALIVGTIGIILGILSAYIGIGTVLFVINNLLKEILPYNLKLVTYPMFIIIPVIFMIIVIFISSFLPAKRASSVSPIEAIRQNDDIKINKKKIKTLGFVTKLFGIEGNIALKNIKRNKKKYRITIISLFISIVTFIAFSTYLDLGTKSSQEYIGNYDFDILINSMSDINVKDREVLNKIKNNKNTKTYIEAYYFSAYVKTNDISIYTKKFANMTEFGKRKGNDKLINYINILALDDESYLKYKKQLGLKDNKIIIANIFKTMDYSNGNRTLLETKVYDTDNFKFTLCDLDNMLENDELKSSDLDNKCIEELSNFYLTNKYPELLDVYKTYNNGLVIVDKTTYDKLEKTYNSSENNDISIFVKADNYDEIDKLAEDFTDEIGYNNLTKSMEFENNVILVIKILLYGFISLVTLIGVTSVFNTINTSIMLRKKEFAILRSIGLTQRGFNKMIWFESIFFGIKSLLYGIPFGLLLSFLISKNMDILVSSISIYIPYKAIIISILAVFIITLLTMMYSTKKIKHENILDAIREENI